MTADAFVVTLLVELLVLVDDEPCHDTESEATALPVWNPALDVTGTTTRWGCPLHE